MAIHLYGSTPTPYFQIQICYPKKSKQSRKDTFSHVAFFLVNLVSNKQNNGLRILFQVQLSFSTSGTYTIPYEQFMDNGYKPWWFFMEFWQAIPWITNNNTHQFMDLKTRRRWCGPGWGGWPWLVGLMLPTISCSGTGKVVVVDWWWWECVGFLFVLFIYFI